jgi:predicted secreted protein
VITNTLLWDNTATISGTQILNSSDSRVTISNSVVQSGCPSQSTCTNINMDDPLLGTLGNYGGSTQTIPLLPGSSAINATSTNCPLTDQRGFPRSSPDCDIGSFESQGFTLTKSGGDNQLAIINTTFTNPLSVTLHETGVSVLPGAVITFTAPSSNQSITPPTTITATTNASGIASIPITANGNPGSYNATASTSGATSVTFALTNTVNTTTTLTSLPNPSTYGQAVIFTATVTSPVGTLTGSVNFFDNSTNVGSGTLNASGIATTTVSTLSAGPHPTITAQYLGNTGYLSSTSSNYSQTVNQANTTTSLTSSPNSSTFGQSITITATVSPSNATGTVQFYADGSTFGSPIALSSGKAVTTTTSLGVGSHSITTIYSGDANYNTSASSLITQIVNIASTTITLTSSPNPSQVGQSVTFTATVSIAAGARPIVRAPQSGCVFTGTIQFKDSSTNMGSSQSLDSNCQATYITNTLTAGNHPITAAYSGDVNSSSSTVTGFTQMVGNIIKIYFPFIRR